MFSFCCWFSRVDEVDVDKEERKVTVSGNVDPAILIQALKKKTGKRAELLDSEGGSEEPE